MNRCTYCGVHLHDDDRPFRAESHVVCGECLASRFPNLSRLWQTVEYTEDTLRARSLTFWPTYIRTIALGATGATGLIAPIIVFSQKVTFQSKMTFMFLWVGSLLVILHIRLVIEFFCTILRLPRVCRICCDHVEIYENKGVRSVAFDRCSWREAVFVKERNFSLFLTRIPMVSFRIPGDEIALGHDHLSVDVWREVMDIHRIPKCSHISHCIASDLWFTAPSSIGIRSAVAMAFTYQSELILTRGLVGAYSTGLGFWLAKTVTALRKGRGNL